MNKQFRIWDGQHMRYSADMTHTGLELRPEKFQHFCRAAFIFNFASSSKEVYEKAIIHAFTNALDKNNHQIYEGDILLWNNPDPYDGEEFVTKIVGYNKRTMGFRLYNFPEEIGEKCGSSFFPEDVEVVGNIFEGASKDGVDYGKYLKEKIKC